MMKLSESEKKELSELVKSIERETSGEVVPLVVDRSIMSGALPDWYLGVGALLGLSVVWWIEQQTAFPLVLDEVLAGLGLWMTFLMVLTLLPFMQRLLLSKRVRAESVEQRAHAEFLLQGLTKTRDRDGVLVLVSLFERRLRILADSGISAKVTASEWQAIADRAAGSLSRQGLFPALKEAITEVGALLRTHFPRDPSDLNRSDNELSDEVRMKR